ncbi:MAG TPA: flagellar biosynthetic protein FliO [Pseudolabrys sp.]|nr:flagellar biosynthetic protein FliO [Pseudolabrys sp.]
MFDLLGSEMPLAVKFFIAFAVVLALIGLTAWLVRRFGSNRLGTSRGRQPRLAVIDAAAVDGRRRLVLIRRDNIEHLLMIGGPTDLVVEPNIVRAVGATAREVSREQPPRVAPEAPPRVTPPAAAENTWPLQPASEPAPIAAPRPYRANATEEPWLPPEPAPRTRPSADLSGLAGELSARLNPPDLGTPAVRAEPRIAPALASEPASPQNDHNLAEMALQLEAALRRAPVAEGRPPVTDPLATSPAAPAKASEPPRVAPREARPRGEPKLEPKLEMKLEGRLEPKPEPKLEPKLEPAATPGKNLYDNLEQEMASLLGRPPGKP